MAIPPNLQVLIHRLNRELNEIEKEATQGLNLVRPLLSRFPENVSLSQFFAYFSSALFFAEMTKTRRIPTITEQLSTEDVTLRELQETGEELGTLLGQVLETKIAVRRLIERLENQP